MLLILAPRLSIEDVVNVVPRAAQGTSPSGTAAFGARGRLKPLGMTAIAVTFLALISVVIIGSLTVSRGASVTQRAVQLNSAYQHAASGIAAEESLERKYRLEPGSAPLAAHRDAEHQVSDALDEVRRLGTAADRRLVLTVAAEHAGYVLRAGELFAAVERHEPTATVSVIDSQQVDPVFGAMQTEIYTAAARHEAVALRQVAASRAASRVIVALDLATLVVGVGLILVGGLTLARSQRRLREERDANLHLALHDGLTGLPNRTLFRDRTEQALRAAQRSGQQVAVMFVDLDRFKDVNDTLGHQYGDLLLVQVAQRFLAAVRAEDSVARLGGDEFAVLMSVSAREEAVAAAQRLTRQLQTSINVKEVVLDVEASIGIALAPGGGDVETLLRHADVAMYEAKAQHLPYSMYELTRDDHTVARLALLGELRRGITDGELRLHYQPKVNARTGQLHGVEALVRWHHPRRGLLMPDTFIPVAESTAVIHPLTAEVLRLALAQTRSWLDRGWRVPIAVNISTRSLQDLDFPEQVQRLLHAACVPGAMLSLELTESAIMSDPDRAITVLDALNALGICLSIDDFGTGYSSMSYLKRLPVRELKIDRSFVAGLTNHADDVILVQSAVDLGHNLGLRVVAEGVEDADTQRMLAAMGCDEIQGYFISRPVPEPDSTTWIAARQQRRRRDVAAPHDSEHVEDAPGVVIGTAAGSQIQTSSVTRVIA